MSRTIHPKFMKQAISKALNGIQRGQTPFGACIVRKNRVLASAHNVVWKMCDITAHAEIQAIRLACKKLRSLHLKDCVLYSTCEPCPMCFSAIHWAGIRKVYYGADIRDAKRLGFRELSISNRMMKRLGKSKVRLQGHLLYRENLELFAIWSKRSAGKTY